ncbi:MAG: hypothetical protein JNK85_05995 [Verrucomicrobiales bacterium]|nr:hypothetical protein [Verrucomicrobiales bacterium]
MRSHRRCFRSRVILGRLLLLAPIAPALLWNLPILAQGTVRFSTFGPGVNAPITYAGDNTLADCRFVAQLYGAPTGSIPKPLGTPVPFLCDSTRGYILDGGVVEVPGVAPGMPAIIAVFAWSIQSGPTYGEAIENCGATGVSRPIVVITGGGNGTAALLTGLQGFEMYVPIGSCPEPGVATLGCMGATLLAFRSRHHFKHRRGCASRHAATRDGRCHR